MERNPPNEYTRRRQLVALATAGLLSLAIDMAVVPVIHHLEGRSGSASYTNPYNPNVQISNGVEDGSNPPTAHNSGAEQYSVPATNNVTPGEQLGN